MMEASSDTFNICIIGGGIAGLATAIALKGAGRSILVLEQSALNREIGAVISLQPNASKIVEKKWGLGPVLKERRSMVDEAFRICSLDGKEQNRVNLKAKVEYGGDRVVYHRQDLHEVLKVAAQKASGTAQGATIRTSSKVSSVDCEEGTIHLQNGEILSGFDLIVGADGIRSNTRTSVLGTSVPAIPTGLSAYRMMINAADIEGDETITQFMDPKDPCTTMVIGYDCRLVMGPARNGQVYSIVAMVPDTNSKHDSETTSWNTHGDMKDLMESFKDFPPWCHRLFSKAPELGLWQLRDLDPLPTWVRGRTIIIGDASHAMLPTQGQGASQSIEDAEAIGAFFQDINAKPQKEEVHRILKEIETVRKPRATLIQQYSRQTAKPGTEKGKMTITLNPGEFMDYNCLYNGAKDWQQRVAQQASPV